MHRSASGNNVTLRYASLLPRHNPPLFFLFRSESGHMSSSSYMPKNRNRWLASGNDYSGLVIMKNQFRRGYSIHGRQQQQWI